MIKLQEMGGGIKPSTTHQQKKHKACIYCKVIEVPRPMVVTEGAIPNSTFPHNVQCEDFVDVEVTKLLSDRTVYEVLQRSAQPL